MPIDNFLTGAKQKASKLTEKLVTSDFGKEIDASELVNKVKGAASKTATKAKKIAKEAADTTKKHAYSGAGVLEKQVVEKRGIGGAARGAIRKSKIFYKGVKLIATPATNKIKRSAGKIYQYNEGFINTFTTNGKYDPNKRSDFIKNKAAIVDKKGIEFFNWLLEASKKGASLTLEDYRKTAPSLKELQGKYEGFGSKYKGFISKPDLEKSLEFRRQTLSELSDVSKNNPQLLLDIINDIKAYAIISKEDLLNFYMPDGDPGENQDKVKVIVKYFSQNRF